MLTETFNSIIAAARKLFANPRALVLIAIVYAALLASLYFFTATREASMAQVVLTFALALASVVLFFLLHTIVAAAITGDVAGGTDLAASSLIRRSLANCWKLIVISVPLIALAILISYLLGKAKTYFGVAANDVNDLIEPISNSRSRKPALPPIDWRVAILSSIRYLAFGLALPLATIHLWLAVTSEGLWAAVRRVGNHLAKAFAPQSVLIYIAGFLVFGLLPYWLLFRTIQTGKAWLEISFLVARLVAVFALTLFGWVITVWALSIVSGTRARAVEISASPAIPASPERASEAV